jgi:hypothetical protein
MVTERLLPLPARQQFGHRVHKGHRPVFVRGDDCVTDALQCRGQPSLACQP